MLISGALLIVLAGIGYLVLYAFIARTDEPSTVKRASKSLVTTEDRMRDPTVYDPNDIDYAEKKLIHHQLATLLADKAKADASRPAIRQLAERVSIRETERANVYAALLISWDEAYMNISDFPEKNGCNGYPTFSGMLSHSDVGSYRLSSNASVDTKFISLLLEHHEKANDLAKVEGAKIGFGRLIELRKASQKEYMAEISELEDIQKAIL